MTNKKINWKKLMAKGFEDAIKKAVELLILALLLGATLKLILIAVPAVSLGAIVSKICKITFFD
jgi:hypothetical protein